MDNPDFLSSSTDSGWRKFLFHYTCVYMYLCQVTSLSECLLTKSLKEDFYKVEEYLFSLKRNIKARYM